MADVLHHTASAHPAETSYDITILVAVTLFTAGVIVVLFANALSSGIDPINLDLVNAYP